MAASDLPASTDEMERPAVLVADDNALLRRLVGAALRDGGFEVTEAADGLAALQLASTLPFAVVLLDEQMPGLTGRQVLQRLRATRSTATLPVILVTAAESVTDRVAGLLAGADDYVTKPFSMEEVLARVHAQIRAHRAWQETIASHTLQRGALAHALEVAGRQESLEAASTVLCNAVVGQGDIGSAVLVRFAADGSAIPAACCGIPMWGLSSLDPAAPMLRRYLAEHSRSGPWLERGRSAALHSMASSNAVACAPLAENDSVFGVLLLGLADEASIGPDEALAAAIDFAAVAKGMLRSRLISRHHAEAERMELRTVLREQAFAAHFQPIVRLADRMFVGVEALTRFADGSNPETRFREAAILGLGIELERATLARALADATVLPADTWVSVNVSPSFMLGSHSARDVLDLRDRGIVLELSEQEPVSDYDGVKAAVAAAGEDVRLSIDDAGSGFASLRHILQLQPSFVKLDKSWVHSVDSDPARQALIAGLRHFADQTGAELIAEGVETEAERRVLLDLRVDYGQGFLLGRPALVA